MPCATQPVHTSCSTLSPLRLLESSRMTSTSRSALGIRRAWQEIGDDLAIAHQQIVELVRAYGAPGAVEPLTSAAQVDSEAEVNRAVFDDPRTGAGDGCAEAALAGLEGQDASAGEADDLFLYSPAELHALLERHAPLRAMQETAADPLVERSAQRRAASDGCAAGRS
jgi:hypothetical protein